MSSCSLRVNNSRRKWRGAKLHGPPRQSWWDVIYTFLGAFVTMLTVLKISATIEDVPGWAFDGGWYSSTLCIVYALTPAPVGQPRQIFAAHLWNMLVGIALRQIPTTDVGFMQWDSNSYGLPLIWKQALAVGLGISGQAKIGILHPPATGLSFGFVTRPTYTWQTILSIMVTDVVVVILSMTILNMEEKKQYPLYWLGFGWEGTGGSAGVIRSKRRNVMRGVSSAAHSVRPSNRNTKKKKKVPGDEAV